MAIAIPFTTWSVNNVSTQTQQHAAITSYYYSQYSSAWQTSTCKLATYGCFEASLAMGLKRYVSDSYNPLNVAKAVGSGCSSGTNVNEQDSIMQGYARNKGLATVTLRGDDLNINLVSYGSKKFNYSLANNYINNGYMLILSGCMKYYRTNDSLSSSPISHAIAVIDVNTSTHVLTTLDPTKEKGIRYFNGDTDIKDCPGVVNGWVSAYAVKKPNNINCSVSKCPL
jgi:hypothetical protein